MAEILTKLGVSSAIGILLGLLAIMWIEPATNGGVALLLIISIGATIIVGAVVTFLRDNKKGIEPTNPTQPAEDLDWSKARKISKQSKL